MRRRDTIMLLLLHNRNTNNSILSKHTPLQCPQAILLLIRLAKASIVKELWHASHFSAHCSPCMPPSTSTAAGMHAMALHDALCSQHSSAGRDSHAETRTASFRSALSASASPRCAGLTHPNTLESSNSLPGAALDTVWRCAAAGSLVCRYPEEAAQSRPNNNPAAVYCSAALQGALFSKPRPLASAYLHTTPAPPRSRALIHGYGPYDNLVDTAP